MSVIEIKETICDNLKSHILKRKFEDLSCAPKATVCVPPLSESHVQLFAQCYTSSVGPVVYLPQTAPFYARHPSIMTVMYCSVEKNVSILLDGASRSYVLHAICQICCVNMYQLTTPTPFILFFIMQKILRQ